MVSKSNHGEELIYFICQNILGRGRGRGKKWGDKKGEEKVI
jgi:hypothetical protein